MVASPAPLVHETIGPFLVGFIVSILLFGIFLAQLYVYFLNFRKDLRWLQLLVWLVGLLELIHLISISHTIYCILITNFGDLSILETRHIGFQIAGIVSNLVATIVKAFFIFRIWTLSRSLYITVPISLLALASAVTYFVANIIGATTTTVMEFVNKYEWIAVSSPLLGAAADVSITIALCFLLRRSIKCIGSGLHTNSPKIVEKIMAWTLETGLFTSAFQVGLAISAAAPRDSMIWMAFWLCICRCYANTMLATLNGRATLRSMKEPANLVLPTIASQGTRSSMTDSHTAVADSTQQEDGPSPKSPVSGITIVTHIQSDYV